MSDNKDMDKEIGFLRELGKKNRYHHIWKGEMLCNSCFYRWKSRRSSPPARCPKCNSTSLEAIQERSYY